MTVSIDEILERYVRAYLTYFEGRKHPANGGRAVPKRGSDLCNAERWQVYDQIKIKERAERLSLCF